MYKRSTTAGGPLPTAVLQCRGGAPLPTAHCSVAVYCRIPTAHCPRQWGSVLKDISCLSASLVNAPPGPGGTEDRAQ